MKITMALQIHPC